MKKSPVLLIVVFAALTATAQNVGIGDAAPLAKLTVAGSEITQHGYNCRSCKERSSLFPVQRYLLF